MLVWTLPVRLIDVSRGGCLVEVARHLEVSTNGQLEIRTDGVLRVDDVRVCRCRMLEGASRVYHAGVELLRTRRLSRRSLSLALRRIIGEYAGQMPEPVDESARLARAKERETRGKKGACRAPPLPVTVDSEGPRRSLGACAPATARRRSIREEKRGLAVGHTGQVPRQQFNAVRSDKRKRETL
jgi:hypothetical protein